ncbi:hypothetical protein ACFE04_013666 [Oxalis oulophora]
MEPWKTIKWIKRKICNKVTFIILVVAIIIARFYDTFHQPTFFPRKDPYTIIFLDSASSRFDPSSLGLHYDYYKDTCSQAETIIRTSIIRLHSQLPQLSANLLRLFFHDCFIKGCDASIFLDDSHGNSSNRLEKHAKPSQTLKGYKIIDSIKGQLENACPGVVSCADILALATREGVLLAGGPFYPVFTGRRDSLDSHFADAMAEIPRPNGNISETLRLFHQRGFEDRDIVSLLGGHSIGHMSCEFIRDRLYNFSGTGQPDPSIASDFLDELKQSCPEENTSDLLTVFSGLGFGPHYFDRLVRGKGVLVADQQLMIDTKTAALVREYASDNGTKFQIDFANAMVKLSNLSPLTGSQGEVRVKCWSSADS